MATYIPDKDDLLRHQAKMQGGDDTLSYMQTGEIVIPNEVQRKFPQIAAAALAAAGTIQLASCQSRGIRQNH